MPQAPHEEKICHGVSFYQSRHTQIRRLKRLHSPEGFGYRVWTSCWLLMDYLQDLGAPPGLRVMDVGCGWGLAGIFCAKNLQASVICVDAYTEVFPFLRLHAELNRVRVTTLHKRYEDLDSGDLSGVDMLIGADICFWDEMPAQIIPMIDQALASGVRLILIADPGRSSFATLADLCADRYGASTMNLFVRKPHPLSGRVLRIGSQSGAWPPGLPH
jgi:predicted nicotinamide N-methyase